MAHAYRCSQCATDWPAVKEYQACPGCGTKTFSLWDGNPLSTGDAKVRVSTLKFARFYEDSRGVPVDTDADPSGDPNREAIGMWCDHPEADGFICWACDPIPRRPEPGADFEGWLLHGG